MTEPEGTAKAIYDRVMSNQDPETYGWHWIPWEDLPEDQRQPYIERAQERLDEEDRLRPLVKVLEQAERDWEAAHPPHTLLPGAIVPMGYLAQAVLRAGYHKEQPDE